jgi:hypothetical protein
MKISKQNIKDAQKQNEWSLGNKTLYELCKKYPKHTNKQEVIAKIWLIGRAYAAAIERRKKNNKIINDDFYIDKVAPAIIESGLDKHLKKLKKYKTINTKNAVDVMTAHFELQKIFKRLSKLNKVSLASKYLHFHFPKLFFIYDSRAKNAFRNIKLHDNQKEKLDIKNKSVNEDYLKFIENCLGLRKKIKDEFKEDLTPREIDNILIKLTNDNSRKTKKKRKTKTN